ncbi:uncharacterized protein LOC116016440 [Ipomoea triloba]|uniref:uncharacterized protein LOC116016440 n=1 Tax=Ipomoea triloba TaxID=35885 RepID=UPI00125CF628|nr:uncharacterized protein LOC116016440 [Ipomoea triloba]XP_031112558.1 uncharacterized protein LOC116016440 [Ipomoea triloba]
MEAIRAATKFSLSAVRLESGSSSDNGTRPSPHDRNAAPLLSVSKPSWIVRTESNIRRERRQKPDPPCVVCRGNGRVECYDCNGRGRTNYVDLEMLPKGKWPKWCRACGGSGMNHCSRCLGTGEYRYILGFGLTHRQSGDNEHGRIGGGGDRRRRIRSADDLLVNDEECL